jgi:hypothetical protein
MASKPQERISETVRVECLHSRFLPSVDKLFSSCWAVEIEL